MKCEPSSCNGRIDGGTDGRFGTEFLLHRISVGPVVVAAAWLLWRWCLVAVDGGRGGRARRLHARPGVGLDAGGQACGRTYVC